MKKKLIKKTDVILIFAVVCAAAILLVLSHRGDGLTAVISVDGEEKYAVDLNKITEDYDLTLENGVTVHFFPGGVRFQDAPCSGKDCIRFGALTRPGQTAACVPTKTVITVTGQRSENAPDAIAY